MRAVALDYPKRVLGERDVPAPGIPADNHVLFRVREIGICGTDRDLVSFRIAFPVPGEDHLVIGHECVGEVVAIGPNVESIQPGDIVVPLVRRPCDPPCGWCSRGRRDMCSSGKYTERGIVRAHGYFSELAVDSDTDLIRVPLELRDHAILVEPLSVVEKAVGSALRLHPGNPESALVIGAGTIGLLSAMTLRSRGIAVTVSSLEPENSGRAQLAGEAGAVYRNSPEGGFDVIIEAAGSPEAVTLALKALNPAGVLVVLGASTPVQVPMLDLILKNQVVVGSVNAAPSDFLAAVADLAQFPARILGSMVEREPWSAFRSTLTGPLRAPPKIVHVVS